MISIKRCIALIACFTVILSSNFTNAQSKRKAKKDAKTEQKTPVIPKKMKGKIK